MISLITISVLKLPRKRRKLNRNVKESTKIIPVEEIPYNEVLNSLLFSQLKTHLRFLSKFRELFKFFDLDNFGYINHDSLSEMLEILDIADRTELDEINEMLEKNMSSVITFTDLVVEFSNHMMTDQDEKVTLLQFICDNRNNSKSE